MDNVLMEKKVLNIDKSTWKLTKLGELLEDISQRVDNPSQSGYDRFVGLEHFVSGDIKIKNWGTTENLTSSTKAFKAGDILFARRNAYLRRASLVDFDGCCSGDAFVLRENHDKVVPGFLAFFMNSNALWDFANENAAGTMSKRVKWRDLANYEFLLPPKDQQAQLAELLWAMDEVVEREWEIAILNEGLLNGFVEDVIHGRYLNNIGVKNTKIGDIPENWDVVNMEDVVTVNDGAHHTPSYTNKGVPFLRVTDIQEEFIDLTKVKFISEKEHQELCKRCNPEKGDILYSKNGTIGISKIVDWDWEFSTFVSLALFKIKDKDILDINYLKLILDSVHIKKEIRRRGKQGTITNLHLEEIRLFRLPLPSIKKQREIARSARLINRLIDTTHSKISNSKALQKSLINQIF
ncbi:MAG: restriction endonuclease subunit S [Bacteroidia bacterium]|nr:restriction endonuclease subunit S [Bacteroidia bacterium]